MTSFSTARRLRLATRQIDAHGPQLLSLASTLSSTGSRAERLVAATISHHDQHDATGRAELGQLAGSLHARWVATHSPRSVGAGQTTDRGRVGALTDQQVGLLALCLFGGLTHGAAGHALQLTPHESASMLGDVLRLLA